MVYRCDMRPVYVSVPSKFLRKENFTEIDKIVLVLELRLVVDQLSVMIAKALKQDKELRVAQLQGQI